MLHKGLESYRALRAFEGIARARIRQWVRANYTPCESREVEHGPMRAFVTHHPQHVLAN